MQPASIEAWNRADRLISEWRVAVERVAETEGSILAFGRRGGLPVVLKVIKSPGDEWRSGAILKSFEGRGAVRVYEHQEGALLLEQARPGRSLESLTRDGGDEAATAILAALIRSMSGEVPPAGSAPSVADWGRSFERYAAGRDTQIPRPLLSHARQIYTDLCLTQRTVRLLHGDLHHGNVLFDETRGWLAIDPKGVVGEIEFETGAALRNPRTQPALFTGLSNTGKRVDRFARDLGLDPARVVSWAFAQAVLAAVWSIEDGDVLEPDDASMTLAKMLQPLVADRLA